MTEPEVLKVQWLEEGLLVHGIIMAGSGTSIRNTHALATGALAALGAAAWALGAHQLPLAAGLGAAGLGCTAALGRVALQQHRAVPAPPRRLLVEIGPEKLSWTAISGDRWSMRHDHETLLTGIASIAPDRAPEGAVVRVRLGDGSAWEVPLHGLPDADARWLAERVTEAAAAARR